MTASWDRLEPDDYLARFGDDLIFYFQGVRVLRSAFEGVVRGSMAAHVSRRSRCSTRRS
jgi:hypothetical protein